MVTISENAWRQEGSKMFIEVGKQVSVDNLIQGMIVQSGNDATVALAENSGRHRGCSSCR
jgi:serine-type D-Ala-D-Ala carboxypeptidase (penicillin-binding protein 5/6)